MTAYLRRGDKIHIMLGVPADPSPRRWQEDANQQTEIVKSLYAQLGVEVIITSTTSNAALASHDIIAVFRDEESVEDEVSVPARCTVHECEVCKDGL
jgi:hypothetical protein